MANMKLYKPNRQTSDEEQQQRQPTPSHDHAASRLVKTITFPIFKFLFKNVVFCLSFYFYRDREDV